MQLQERRAILKRFVEEYGFDLVAAYTARKNEAKTNKNIPLFKEKKTGEAKTNKNIPLFKEKKTGILMNQNLTTEGYLLKIDAGYYDDGYAIILGTIRRGR